jgi:hypothetical protein
MLLRSRTPRRRSSRRTEASRSSVVRGMMLDASTLGIRCKAGAEDDEPWTEQDDAAMAKSRADLAAGRTVPHQEMLRKYG